MSRVAHACPRTHRFQRGFVLIETLIAVFLLTLVITVILNFSVAASRTADRQMTEDAMSARGRTALGEMLREMRSASGVTASQTIGGTIFTSDSSNLVLQAPAYDAASSAGILTGTDYIAFRYNTNAKTITESTSVTTGSTRPARTNRVIARQVQSVQYTYNVREVFTSTGSAVFTPSAAPLSGLTAYVNGQRATSCTYSSGNNRATVTPTPADGATVQILYTVDPALGAPSLRMVMSVDVAITLSDTGGRRTLRVPLSGSARLRNFRL